MPATIGPTAMAKMATSRALSLSKKRHNNFSYIPLTSWRGRIMERDRRKCQFCGAKQNLHVHYSNRVVSMARIRFQLSLCASAGMNSGSTAALRIGSPGNDLESDGLPRRI